VPARDDPVDARIPDARELVGDAVRVPAGSFSAAFGSGAM
jgi:hypothetical protein